MRPPAPSQRNAQRERERAAAAATREGRDDAAARAAGTGRCRTDGQFLKNALGGNGASRFAYQQAGFQYP